MQYATGKTLERKLRKRICIVSGCSKPMYIRKSTKRPLNDLCNKHNHELKQERNPLKYCYSVLRRNAKRRSKQFDLTFDEFKEFCERTNYLEIRGRNKCKATIDRIRDNEGYNKDNIQIMLNGDNVKKKWVHYWMEKDRSDGFEHIYIDDDGESPIAKSKIEVDDLPF